jgi:5-methylcytosine-specific restriction endonuclease McrA
MLADAGMTVQRRWVPTRRYNQTRRVVLANATHCHLCGLPFNDPRDPPVCDHLIPTSLGGGDHINNLAAAHKSCNGRRGNKLLHEMQLPLSYRPPGWHAPRQTPPAVYVTSIRL